MKIVGIIQARRGSTRLPDKVFLDIQGKPLIEHVVKRLSKSERLNEVVIATTLNPLDDKLEEWCKSSATAVFRGDEENVLKRYYEAALAFHADIIVRITADDPFKDYRLIDQAIEELIENKRDFVCNNNPVSFPEGLDVEVMTFDSLKVSYENAITDFQKEHVTQYIHMNKKDFNCFNISNFKDLSGLRWTLDTASDYEFTNEVYRLLYKKDDLFLTEEIYDLLEAQPHLIEINSNVKRSDLYQ